MSIVNCKNCNCEINVTPSRVWRTKYCSEDCRNDAKQKIINSRKRFCLQCNKEFTPRKQQIDAGLGKFCSQKCNSIVMVKLAHTPEANQKRTESFLKSWNPPKGENHPRWKGGQKQTTKRRIKSGKANESLKKYRANNPDKVREWSSTRHKRKTGRLPKGTVKKLLQQQNNLCVYCECDISVKYHVDHIIPLSKGGEHKAENIQILCPSCNVKKSAKLNYVPNNV